MSTRRNTNLNKELGNDWIGRVRKWEKKWVACEDKSAPQLPHGAKRPLQLLKWVQTEVRAKPQAAPRYPHIVPVKDLSLVPGARLGTPVDAAAAAGQVADPLAAPPIQIDLTPEKAPPTQTAAVDTAAAIVGQQQRQQDGVTAAGAGLPPLAPSAAAAAGPGSSLVDPGVQGSQAAAAAAAAGPTGSLGADGAILPSPSGTTGTVNFDLSYDYAQHPVSSLSRGAFDPFSIPPQLPAAAASDYTAGTDSEALGRLPHGGLTASDYTGGGDSMDVDLTQPTGEVDMEDDDEDDDDVVDGDEDHDEDEDDDDDDHRGVIGADDDEDDDEEDQDGLGDDDDGINDDDDMPS